MSDQMTDSNSETDYEVTVSEPATTTQFIDFLRSKGFTGNVGVNPNSPGIIWFGATSAN